MKNLMIKMFGKDIESGFTYHEDNDEQWVLALDVCKALGSSSTTQTLSRLLKN